MPDATDGAACPSCKRPTDAKRRCWWCFDRPCQRCERPTGGCFFPLCLRCEAGDGAEVRARVPDAPGEEPTPPRRWVLVVQARKGPAPTAVRVRQVIKSLFRYHGLECVALRLDVPDGTDVDEVVEE